MNEEIFDIDSMIKELENKDKDKDITVHKIGTEQLEITIESIEPKEEKTEPEEKQKEEIKTEVKEESKDESEDFDMKRFNIKMNMLEKIINIVRGGVSIESRVKPVLNPENWKTSSNYNRGEINMIWAFLTMADISPEECEPLVDASINYALLNLSKDGFGLLTAVDMGKALTEISTTKSYSEKEIERPTEGMKE